MNRRVHPSRGVGAPSRKRLTALAACAAALLLPLLVWARQPAQPTAQASPAVAPQAQGSPGGPISAAGFNLEKKGFYTDKWPTVRFEFNLWNEAQEPFDKLKASDIKARFEGQEVPIPEGALVMTGSEPAPAHAIILIDGSGSMVGRRGEMNKLAAAKDALRSFVSSLGAHDTLSVYAFDKETYPVVAKGVENKTSLIDSIYTIKPRPDRDEFDKKYSDSTDLYGAIDQMLDAAPSQKARHLIVLSDGMQDTPDARAALQSPEAFQKYKSEKEREIRQRATAKGVRLYTLAIGDENSLPKHPDNLAYVDDETLTNIANENQGGIHEYIDMPSLIRSAQTSSASYESFLAERLKSSLAKFREAFRYGYSLELTLRDFPRDGKEHTLEMNFPAGSKSSFPAVTYPLFWGRDDSVPQTGTPTVFTAVFLDAPRAAVMPVSLGAIYAGGLGMLGLLAGIPLLLLRVQKAAQARAEERAVATAVIAVQKKSPYVGKSCPNDPTELIKPGDVIVVCPKCNRPHHLECWLYAKSRCMYRYCLTELPIPDAVLKRHGLKSA